MHFMEQPDPFASMEVSDDGGAYQPASALEAPVADVSESAAETPVETPAPEPAPDEEPDGTTRERNEDGTFKAKPAEPDAKAEKPTKWAKPRIDQLTREKEEARREAATAREEAAQLRRDMEALRKPAAPVPQQTADAEAAPRPNPDDTTKYPDGKYDTAFIEDLAGWRADQVLAQRERDTAEKARVAHLQADQQARVQAVTQRIKGYSDRLVQAGGAEFVATLSPEVRDLRPTAVLQADEPATPLSDFTDELLSSEQAPAMLRHLSDHPDDLRRISALRSRKDVLREFHRLEVRCETASAGSVSTPPPISQAKPPVRPVSGSPHASADDGSEDEPLSAYIARQNAKDSRRRH